MAALWTESKAGQAGRWAVWPLFALLLIVAPLLWSSHLSVTVLTQMGIAIVACLSYNILFGQGGMLSFGHAVYSGLGAYVSIHALNAISSGQLGLPVSLVPLVGGVAGLFFSALLGYLSTRRAGTAFAMISLGVGELVFASALMFSGFFGGESGISANRVAGSPWMGISFGPPIQVYYLIAAYAFVCVALMYAFTQTPLGRLLNAVRDNPERVAFIGYNPQVVRYLAFMVAGFFAGIAGGMGAVHFEIVSSEALSAARSGSYLLFTVLGGSTVFFGPVIGGVLMVLASVLLPELTRAWVLYLGLVFLFTVMYAPGGVASLLLATAQQVSIGRLRAAWVALTGMVVSAGLALLAGGALVEMVYHLQLGDTQGDPVRYLGLALDARSGATWLSTVLVTLAALAVFHQARRRFKTRWSAPAAVDTDRSPREAA